MDCTARFSSAVAGSAESKYYTCKSISGPIRRNASSRLRRQQAEARMRFAGQLKSRLRMGLSCHDYSRFVANIWPLRASQSAFLDTGLLLRIHSSHFSTYLSLVAESISLCLSILILFVNLDFSSGSQMLHEHRGSSTIYYPHCSTFYFLCTERDQPSGRQNASLCGPVVHCPD